VADFAKFMVGLASQRRANNLPASVIDIGMIIGLGFIQRTDIREGASSTESALHNLDYMPVSERDLHQILAEAILAGQSEGSPEVITGLHVYDTGHSPFWHTKALFSHLRSKAGFEKRETSQDSVEKPLKERLRDAGGMDEALAIMEETFMKYLASSLKVSIIVDKEKTPLLILANSWTLRVYTLMYPSLTSVSILWSRWRSGTSCLQRLRMMFLS
jgi:hypothetical protein